MKEDCVYCFCSYNAFKGAQTAFEKLLRCFIEPYLSYKKEYDGPIDVKGNGTLDNKFRGEIKTNVDMEARVSKFRLVTVHLPETQQDEYSCGFWAVRILLDIAVQRIHPAQIKTRLGDPERYRLVLAKILRSRYLYYENFYERPKRQEEEEEKQDKKGGNSAAAAIAEDIPDDKSDVSVLTVKTNKSSKHVDKHCPACDFKIIPGRHWARHCKSFHDERQVQGLKCGLDCLRCKGKYNF